eukprot:1129144-Amphidinium_carterae.1
MSATGVRYCSLLSSHGCLERRASISAAQRTSLRLCQAGDRAGARGIVHVYIQPSGAALLVTPA